MPVILDDFGLSIIDVSADDTFFLDTNFIVAACNKEHKYHKACATFLFYLYGQGIKLYISEVVVMEVMHTLARSLYVDNEFQSRFGHLTLTESEKKEKEKRILSNWGNITKQAHNKHILQKYNEEAKDIFNHVLILPNIVCSPSSKPLLFDAIDMSVVEQLNSADALIASMAKFLEVSGLISLDKDMFPITSLSVLTTNVKNDDFDDTLYEED